jgi:hypothetical protein
LSFKVPVLGSSEIQCAVIARNGRRLSFDQMSAVWEIQPGAICEILAHSQLYELNTYGQLSLQHHEILLPCTDDVLMDFCTVRDLRILEVLAEKK